MASDHMEKYSAFYESARHNNGFDDKTATLLHLAAALALGCEP